jgi:hypothetical protein
MNNCHLPNEECGQWSQVAFFSFVNLFLITIECIDYFPCSELVFMFRLHINILTRISALFRLNFCSRICDEYLKVEAL